MDTDKNKQVTDTGASTDAGKNDKLKKITLSKTGKTQIIINPPEKIDTQRGQNEAFKQALQKHAVIFEKKIEIVLQSKAQTSGLPEETIQQVFVRGYKNLPLNTDLTREQYAMNRVNSFIAGGAAMVEDCDLLPITERLHTRMGLKGSGGGMRPHIKREKNVYNGKTTFHVVDAKGQVKHSTTDELEAKKHLATKYNSYLGEAKKLKGKDPCWDNYKMVGLKANGDPNCVGPVKEDTEEISEISKELANRYYWSARSSGEEMDKKISSKVKKLKDKWSQKTHNNLTDLLAKSQKRTAGRLRALDRLNKEEVEPVVEASSAAVRMQKALEKIKADRERKERLAAPYVNSVFAKKVEDKKKDVKEGLADDIIAAAKARGINAKLAPPLADRKKATIKLLKHRAKEAKRNPAPPKPAAPAKTGFRSGAIDDTYGT